MKHAISSIFNAAMGFRGAANDVILRAAPRAPMVELSEEQMRFVAGGDDAEVDGLPKGGWKATSSTAS